MSRVVIRRLDEIEREAIEATLVHFSGNRTHAARLLGISVRTMRNKLARYRADDAQTPDEQLAQHMAPYKLCPTHIIEFESHELIAFAKSGGPPVQAGDSPADLVCLRPSSKPKD